MNNIINRRGESSGPLQSLMLALILMAAVSISAASFLTGLAADNDVQFQNESAFKQFHSHVNETSSVVIQTKDDIANIGNNDAAFFTNLIDVVILGGFKMLISMIFLPIQIFSSLFSSIFAILPIPPELVTPATLAVMVVIIFGAAALIFKIRG